MASSINTAHILALADTAVSDDAAKYGTVLVQEGSFGATLKAAADKRRADAEEKAASAILDTVEVKNSLILAKAQRIATLKQEIATVEKDAELLAKAEQYGFATRNFLPLALLTGLPVPAGARKELLSIPKDWTPVPVVEAPATAATAN